MEVMYMLYCLFEHHSNDIAVLKRRVRIWSPIILKIGYLIGY